MNERYLELKEIADRIEQIRLELWQSEEHEKCMDDEEEKDYVQVSPLIRFSYWTDVRMVLL